MKECPGGRGKMTATQGEKGQSISFDGFRRIEDGKEVKFSNSGSWEFVGSDALNYNRRKYALHWGNDTDTVVLSDAANYLKGSNSTGKCRVTGKR